MFQFANFYVFLGSRKVHTRLAQGSYTLLVHACDQVSSNALNFIQPTFIKLTDSPMLNEHCSNRYNKPCNGACASRGEEYFWCKTWDGSWEYCSPRVDEKPVYAKEGQPCAGSCDKREKSYKYCPVVSVAEFSIKKAVSYYWDYCGTAHKNRVSSSSLVQIGYLALTFGLLSTGLNSF